MKDIRIISGKRIQPDFAITASLLGYKNTTVDQTTARQLFQECSLPIQMRLRPKAALLITKPSFPLPCEELSDSSSFVFLYAMLTIGDGVTRLIEKYTSEQEMLKATMTDAMADSCLFAFEQQLLPMIRQICLEEGYGIGGRLEISKDLPMEMQSEIFHALDASRTLGLSMTSGSMLNPAKSMSLVFTLTDDLSADHLEHDCSRCTNKNCPLRTNDNLLLQVKWRPDSAHDFETKKILCPPSSNLLEVLQENQIFLPAYCGGKGICGKCGIRILEGSLPITEDDRRIFSESELENGMRLSCLAEVKNPVSILVENRLESDFKALGSSTDEPLYFEVTHTYSKGDYGIAIDIGTTTLAFSLLDLHTGVCLDTQTMVNSQRAFGADVISRIQASNTGKKELLQKSIQADIQKGISLLIRQNLTGTDRLCHVVIAANTVMLHLLMGYSCEGFSHYPFCAKTLELEEFIWKHPSGIPLCLEKQAIVWKHPSGIPLCLEKQAIVWKELPFAPKVTLLPGISPFVGADITAGLYVCHVLSESQPVFFLDLGTNGEMALWKNQKLFVTSTAAGPAFEGGNIKWGMGSIPGAISAVKIENNLPFVQTIGDKQPEGLCGTGVIETVAELLRAGILDETGKLDDSCFREGYPLAQTKDSTWIRFTQQDVREIQMAKAAIRAGIETLLYRSNTSYDEISKVYLAGGFGYYLNVEKTAAISLLPKEFLSKTVSAGNTSLKGALLYLAEQKKDKLWQIQDAAKEIPLAKDERFMELYLKYMAF